MSAPPQLQSKLNTPRKSSQASSQPTPRTRAAQRHSESFLFHSSDSEVEDEAVINARYTLSSLKSTSDSQKLSRSKPRAGKRKGPKKESRPYETFDDTEILSPTISQLDAMPTPPAEQIDPPVEDTASQTRGNNGNSSASLGSSQLSQTFPASQQSVPLSTQISDIDAGRQYFAENISWPTEEAIHIAVTRIIFTLGRKALDVTIEQLESKVQDEFGELQKYRRRSPEAEADVAAFWRKHAKMICELAIEETEECKDVWASSPSESEEAIVIEDGDTTDATQANLGVITAETPPSPRIKMEGEDDGIHVATDEQPCHEDTEESDERERIVADSESENKPRTKTIQKRKTKRKRSEPEPKPEEELTEVELKRLNQKRGETPGAENFKYHMKYTPREDKKLLKLVETAQPQGDQRRWELIAKEMKRTLAGVRQRYYALMMIDEPRMKRATVQTSWTRIGTFQSGFGYMNMIIDALETHGGQASRQEIMDFIGAKYDRFLNHAMSSKGMAKWKRGVYSTLERNTRVKRIGKFMYELAADNEKEVKPARKRQTKCDMLSEDGAEVDPLPPKQKRRKTTDDGPK